jgi:hypothetical protein
MDQLRQSVRAVVEMLDLAPRGVDQDHHGVVVMTKD